MAHPNTWLDISHIIGWQGNLTGIERVEYHLIKHYFHNSDAGFIYWDNDRSNFQIASRDFVKKMVINRSSEAEQKAAPVVNQSTILQKMHTKIRRALIDNKTHIHEGTVIILAGLWDNRGYISGVKKLADSHALIHVVYDMIPLLQPGYVVEYLPAVFEEYMLAVLPKCTKILAISEATKNDTIRVLKSHKLPVPEVIAFRLGDDITRANVAIKPKGVPEKYILSVSTVEARKNHQLLYYVQKLAQAKNINIPPMVIAGKLGWLTNDLQYMLEKDPEMQGKITLLDSINDMEMRWLYENSWITIFPSIYEGWGLPVAEALSYGKVVLASNTSSIPEVGGSNVDYFSPFSTDELLALIQKYSTADILKKRQHYIENHYHPTTWEQAALSFSDLINKLAY